MTDIQILTWAIGLGFGATWVIMGVLLKIMFALHKNLDQKMEKLDKRIDDRFNKLDEKVTDIDRRLCRLEGAMMNKEYCMLKHDHSAKAE